MTSALKIKMEAKEAEADDMLETSEDWLKDVKRETKESQESELGCEPSSKNQALLRDETCDFEEVYIQEGPDMQSDFDEEDSGEEFSEDVLENEELIQHLRTKDHEEAENTTDTDSESTDSKNELKPNTSLQSIHIILPSEAEKIREAVEIEHSYSYAQGFFCKLCKMGFRQSRYLLSHMKLHTGDKTYKCKICQKGFDQIGHLRDHSRTHIRKKRFVCNICHKIFTDEKVMKKHEKIHLAENFCSCEFCSKAMEGKKAWLSNAHLWTPYTCKMCSKGFKYKNIFHRHVLNVHK